LKTDFATAKLPQQSAFAPPNTQHHGYFNWPPLANSATLKPAGAFGTVSHRGLTCKQLQLLPDRHIVHMIMEFVWQSQLHPHHRKQQKK